MKDPKELLSKMVNDQLPAWERVKAGAELAKVGDPRKEVTSCDHMEFAKIEAGEFIYGEDESECTKTIERGYEIGVYPVTNAQFRQFTDDDGYRDRRWWKEAVVDGFRVPDGQRDYGEPYNLANHPVVGVSWYEAVAFCRWLTDRLRSNGAIGQRDVVSLPTEAQWERAARGRDGRIYPWGDNPDPDRANCFETWIGTTSAVGCFAAGASPDGVEEMSGNVWEWTRSKWGNGRVVRGGSFLNLGSFARGARRDRLNPDVVSLHWGFRVVFSPSPLKSETLDSDNLKKK